VTPPLYFAPINVLGHGAYRHVLLRHGADYVFSELLMVAKLSESHYQQKLQLPAQDISRTIFQLGVGTPQEVNEGIDLLTRTIDGITEININMGCPQSSLQKNAVCSGLLLHPEQMRAVARALATRCKKEQIIPSVKLRLGPHPEQLALHDYLSLLAEEGITKIYIHLRTLRYNYTKPARWDVAADIKTAFPHLTIILNGDIDSYQRATRLASQTACDGLMIGRAALSNPLVFSQIKQGVTATTAIDEFDPLRNDPQLQLQQQHIVMTQEKKEVILTFLSLATDVPLRVVKANLSWLTKGVSARGAFIDAISRQQHLDDIIETFKAHFSSTSTL
jgi:tRNA-dihydrouridine synthase